MRWRKRRNGQDFHFEIDAHLALEVDRWMAEGYNEAEARDRARRTFGNQTQSLEQFYERRSLLWWDHLRRDFRFALRQLGRNPSFAAITILTLALGIGATTAIFTLVHAALLRALPYPDAGRIVSLQDVRLHGQSTGGLTGVPRFFDVQSRSRAFSSLAFFFFDHPTVRVGDGSPVPLLAVGASGEFWRVLGASPLLGRTFNRSDERPGADRAVVLSFSAWQHLFGGDLRAAGRKIVVDSKPATVVGVMPASFRYPNKVEMWGVAGFQPSEWQKYRGNGTRFVNVLGRLAPGISLAAAANDLARQAGIMAREHPESDADWVFSIATLRDYLYGPVRPALLALLAASGILLLIACVNVANLVSSRARVRVREMVLRRALGASRARIVWQLMIENLLLAALGGMLGVGLAYCAVQVLAAQFPGRLAAAGLSLDQPVVLFALLTATVTALLFGLPAAFSSSRAELGDGLKQGESRIVSYAGLSFQRLLIALETGLSVVLIAGALLLGQSLWQLLNRSLGFSPDHVLTFSINLPWSGDNDHTRRFFDEVQQRISSLPGVTAAGQIAALPGVDWHFRSSFDVDWLPRTANRDAVNVENRGVAGDYWTALRIPVLAGRLPSEQDRLQKHAVALVNQQFVRRYSADGQNHSVLGRHLIGPLDPYVIVGVVGDVRGTAGPLAPQAGPEVYYPSDGFSNGRSFAVRTTIRPESLEHAIRRQVAAVDPTQAIRDVRLLNDVLSESATQPRLNLGVFLAFASIALILACIGIYGVIAFAVSQRTAEIGVRMALGATSREILRLFLAQTIGWALGGLILGEIATLLLSRLIASQLYGVTPGDPFTLVIAAVILLIPVCLAAIRPAWIAARTNPMEALRSN